MISRVCVSDSTLCPIIFWFHCTSSLLISAYFLYVQCISKHLECPSSSTRLRTSFLQFLIESLFALFCFCLTIKQLFFPVKANRCSPIKYNILKLWKNANGVKPNLGSDVLLLTCFNLIPPSAKEITSPV